MFTLTEIIKTIRDFSREEVMDKDIPDILRRKSIIAMSEDSVLYHPVICSNTISMEAVQDCSNAIEKYFATLIQNIISMEGITTAKNPREFVRRIHQNTNSQNLIDAGMLEFLDECAVQGLEIEEYKSFVNESALDTYKKDIKPLKSILKEETFTKYRNMDVLKEEIATVEKEVDNAIELVKELSVDVDDKNQGTRNIRYCSDEHPEIITTIIRSILKNDKKYYTSKGVIIDINHETGSYQLHVPIVYEKNAVGGEPRLIFMKFHGKFMNSFVENNKIDFNKSQVGTLKEYNTEYKDTLNRGILNELRVGRRSRSNTGGRDTNGSSTIRGTIGVQRVSSDINVKMDDETKDTLNKLNNSPNTVNVKGNVDYSTEVRLSSNDVKKVNELVPTQITVETFFDKGENIVKVSFIIGVKTTVHPTTSEQMIENIYNVFSGGSFTTKFIKWTTGEDKFFRDFLLSIDKIKIDAKNASRYNSAWWTKLQRNAQISKFKRMILADKQLLPNTTIFISKTEANILQDEYNVDLCNPANANFLMNKLFLLGICIIDEDTETVEMIFSGEKAYNLQTFDSLKRASGSSNNNPLRDMLKFVDRIR